MARLNVGPGRPAAPPSAVVEEAFMALRNKKEQVLPAKEMHSLFRFAPVGRPYSNIKTPIFVLLLSLFCLLPSAICLLLSASSPALIAQTSGQNPPAPARIDPKAQELLDRAIQGLGGPAFLNFKTLTTSGRIFAISEGVTEGYAPFQSAVEFPDKRRFSYGKKKPVTLINNGDRAWELDKYGLTRQLPEQIQRWKLSARYSLENLLRVRIHDPGVLIQNGGVDFLDNLPARLVNILESEGFEVKLYLHQQTFLPIRIAYRVQDPKTREWDEYADVYADYQQNQGVQTPMHITRFLNDERISEIFRKTARYDESYPPNYFVPGG